MDNICLAIMCMNEDNMQYAQSPLSVFLQSQEFVSQVVAMFYSIIKELESKH